MILLGGFEARLASGATVSLPTKRAQALLAYLGLRPGQSHPRDKLAALLWGEKSDDQARGGLRHALVALRRALAGVTPPALRIEGRTLALNPGAVEIDVAIFERRVAEGTPQALEQAAELYRGDLLQGLTVNEPLFEEWLVAERERLREMALEALARLLAHQTKAVATERAIQTAVRLLGLDPLQEAAHRTLMRHYARQGRRGAALKQYQVCVGALQQELGTAPEAETKNLYQDLLRRPAEAVKPSDYRGEYARVVELATDNLAALPPEWVYEFLGGSQPPSINDRFRLLVSLAHLGRFVEAAKHEAEAIRLAEPTNHAYTVGMAYHAAGTLHLVKGDWAKACALIERQIAVLRSGNIVGELPIALAYSARALAISATRARR